MTAVDDSDDLIHDFVTESREHLTKVEADLLRLEEGGADAATVNNVFRCVHSVKGVAGFLGLQRINELAHVLESTLDLVRKNRLAVSPALVEVLLAAIDRLSQLVEAVHESNAMEIGEHLAALRAVAADDAATSGVAATPAAGAVPGSPPAAAVAAATAASVPLPAAPVSPVAAVRAPQAPPQPPAAPRGPTKAASADRGSAAAEVGVDSVRVHVGLLDRLMNLSGELVLGRNQLLQAKASGAGPGLDLASARISHVVSELQEAIMQTRLQPIGNVFQKFPRVVRDLAQKLGKKARLLLEGKEVELDRSILETLSDPLTHLVRNSIDHGIEMPAVREQRGKPVEGTLTLQASHQGGNVKIQIVDDGAGIDPQRLRSKAVERALITEAQAKAMSDRDAIMLIFAAGFSTAEKVTDVSGRGVGMDVVRTNIEKLGGSIEVQSAIDRGTTIAVTIPLTLAILPALVVSSGDRRYVLPQANVTELVRIRGDDAARRLVQVNGRDVLRLRGRLVPIVHLRQALGVEPRAATAPKVFNIMVVEAGVVQYGLVVDTPPDAEEIVVKPLGRHLKGRPEYSGSTILGDGRVAMILDVSGIAQAANLRGGEVVDEGAGRARDGQRQQQLEHTDVVLFRNHPEETFALPLGLVRRIERFAQREIVELGGGLVHSSAERAMPLLRVDAVVQARPAPAGGERVGVLVVRLEEREFGLVAPEIEDIRSLQIEVDTRTLIEDGVLGSFQLEGRAVRLLDLAGIARRALPRLFPAPAVPTGAATAARPVTPAAAESAQPATAIRVLFAEDSGFFRSHVQRIMTGAGCAVVATEDGDAAWQVLVAGDREFDLVVTDIQMPNCDGLELTRRIRRSERWGQLPVLALTSLSSAEDMAAGQQAGVTEYRVKLDDAALVAAIRELAGRKA